MPAVLFVSYSHHDFAWVERIEAHLKPLEKQGLIEVFIDRRIGPGAAWSDHIARQIQRADVGIFLVSADFLASDFITTNELPGLLAGAQSGRTLLLSIHVSSSQFDTSPLSQYQGVNDPKSPLHGLTYAVQEQVFDKLARTVRERVELPRPGAASAIRPPQAAPAGPEPSPASAREVLSTCARLTEQIDQVNRYKCLHDALHELQSPLNVILRDAPAPDRAAEFPAELSFEIEDMAERLQRAIDAVSDPLLIEEMGTCRTKLTGARAALAEAVATSSRKALDRAVLLVHRVLSLEFSIANDRLVRTARQVQLGEVADGLERLRGLFEAMPSATRELDRLQAESLELQRRLDALAWEHDQWQLVDNELRAALELRERIVEELKSLHWDSIETPLRRVLPARADAPWAVKLLKTLDDLKAALDQGNEPRTQRLLRDVHRSASTRFMQVDKSLLAAGGDLQNVGKTLDTLARTVNAA